MIMSNPCWGWDNMYSWSWIWFTWKDAKPAQNALTASLDIRKQDDFNTDCKNALHFVSNRSYWIRETGIGCERSCTIGSRARIIEYKVVLLIMRKQQTHLRYTYKVILRREFVWWPTLVWSTVSSSDSAPRSISIDLCITNKKDFANACASDILVLRLERWVPPHNEPAT